MSENEDSTNEENNELIDNPEKTDDQTKKLEEENSDLKDKWQRALADYQNLERRTQVEISQRVSSKTKLKVIIPVNFVNEEECAGVKVDGGVVAKAIREIEIMCLAGNIPESIDVDIENLNLGDSIRLTEISLPEGSEIPGLTDETDQMIVSVNAPKAVEEDPIVDETLEDGEVAESEEASDSGSEETTSSDESSSEENSEES